MQRFLYSSKIKNWFKTTNPSIPILIGQFLFSLIPNILIIILALPTAKIITSLTIYDYANAKSLLLIEFILITLINVSLYINSLFFSAQIKYIYKNLQTKIYNKVVLISNTSLQENSKEKLLNIMTTSIYSLAEYTKIFTKHISMCISAIVTLVIVFIYSYIVGLFVLAVSLTVYFLFKLINIKVSKTTLSIQNKRDEICEVFSDVVNGRNEIFDLNQEPGLKEKYINKTIELTKLYKKQNNYDSIKYNWIKIFWKGIVIIGTFLLIIKLQNNAISLTSYLILVPYLTECIEKFITSYDNYYNLEIAHISALRIKTLFDMKEKDVIYFGNNITNNISGTITFSNVSASNEKSLSPSLSPFSYHIEKNKIYIFKGDKYSGKNHIYNILKREQQPNTGTITIDTINIFDFDNDFYKKNLSYTNSNPYFFDMSIMDNFKLINKNKKEIINSMKFCNIDKYINSLPDQYNTNLKRLNFEISNFNLFLLGLSRCKLTKSEIVVINEIPNSLYDEEIKLLKSILTKMSRTTTILIFTDNDTLDNISHKIINVKNGKVYV